MSFVKFELCHYLLKCYNYPMCSLLPLCDSKYMYIRLFIVSYICLALFDKSIFCSCAWSGIFSWAIFQLTNPFFRYVQSAVKSFIFFLVVSLTNL